MKQTLRTTSLVKEEQKKTIEIIDAPEEFSFKIDGMEIDMKKYEIVREGGYQPRLRLEIELDEEVFDLKINGKTAY